MNFIIRDNFVNNFSLILTLCLYCCLAVSESCGVREGERYILCKSQIDDFKTKGTNLKATLFFTVHLAMPCFLKLVLLGFTIS